MINNTVKLCLIASALIALALFVFTLHTGGRADGLSFLELLAIACVVEVVGFYAFAFYLAYLFKVREERKDDYLKYAKAFKLAAGLVLLIGISACAGGGLLIFR